MGHAIKQRRHAHAFTLVDLAERAGLSQPFLSQVENGRARPSMSSLHRIATALGTAGVMFLLFPLAHDATTLVVMSIVLGSGMGITPSRTVAICGQRS